MTAVYCSQGHANPLGSRFCNLCGEKLVVEDYDGVILVDRYRIIRELGHGGFGRTYLAEDLNRFHERCVLKEFAPQVRGTSALQKSEELFEREAGVLYKLRHPQIPQFRELFRARLENQDHLFLVQDFVEGYTYRQLLKHRQQQGRCFSEPEIRQLLEHLLPVLDYLHQAGVIHRDISPDNLIWRSADQLPVLIDFGAVKQVAAAAESQFVAPENSPAAAMTRLGKVGYAPEEQLRHGIVSPQSDLYALAVTVLVLLTGKEPLELLEPGQISPLWSANLPLSPTLTTVLTRMLALQPGNRYQSAQEVLGALQSTPASFSDNPTEFPVPATAFPPQFPDHLPDHSLDHSLNNSIAFPAPSHPTAHTPPARPRHKFVPLLILLLLMGLAGTGWWTHDRWLPWLLNLTDLNPVEPPLSEEQTRQEALRNQRQALGVDQQFLVNLTNARFYQRYPDQQGRSLSDGEADAEWRSRWDEIAQDWLTLLEQQLSPTARRKLGRYTKADREQWKQAVNQLYVGSRSLFDLTDAKFFSLFPEQQGKEFIDQPIGQIWQAIATDQVAALQAGRSLENIQFEAGAYSKPLSSTLQPGEGMIYTANLTAGQILRLSLQAPPDSTRLSVYLPRPTSDRPSLLEDAADVTWSDRLTQSGYYEIVLVNRSLNAIAYHLNIAVDNVTSTPVAPAQPEVPEAKG